MSYDGHIRGDPDANHAKIKRLQSYHKRKYSVLMLVLLVGLILIVQWASNFRIDEIARSSGEVIASSRVQIIQAVDGGVLSKLYVKEGDVVVLGQRLASLDQTRVKATVDEVKVRLNALRTKALRLRAEVTQAKSINFPDDLMATAPDVIKIEKALFVQRRKGLVEDVKTLKVAVKLSKKGLGLTKALYKTGDASGAELLRAEKTYNDVQAKLSNRRNKYLEDASQELVNSEDQIAQNEQILKRVQQQQSDSEFSALVPGIVKNIRVTTVGGVLRPGEEIMQIIPMDDDLILEAKVSPSDIARVQEGLEATIRFDPFDYTIYGGVKGKVIYVSADTLKEETGRGIEIYYRVRIVPQTSPVTTTTGRKLDILPGMMAQIDIRTGDRTLMDYLLKPLKKTLSESFGER